MENKKHSERTCIACRKKGKKEELIRIVKNKQGEITLDLNNKLNGRGCYICNNNECKDNLIKKKALNRAYKMNLESKIYDIINETIKIKKEKEDNGREKT